jgi:type IV pilus assembly protein PilV
MSAVRKQNRRYRTGSRGFTLIEILIAFLILSVGLIGVASLQALSKSSQHQAIQRTKAVALADMMVEMIRSNPLGVVAYDTGVALGAGGGTITDEPDPDCSNGAPCTPAQLAAHDLWEWEQALLGQNVTVGVDTSVGGLIHPRGCIDFTPQATAAGGTLTRTGRVDIRVQFRGLDETSDGVTQAADFCAGGGVGTDPLRRLVAVGTYIVDETEI